MTHRIVTRDIPIGDPGRGQYAFRVGDKVHEQDVEANGWDDYVAAPTSKAGKEAAAAAGGQTEKKGS